MRRARRTPASPAPSRLAYVSTRWRAMTHATTITATATAGVIVASGSQLMNSEDDEEQHRRRRQSHEEEPQHPEHRSCLAVRRAVRTPTIGMIADEPFAPGPSRVVVAVRHS